MREGFIIRERLNGRREVDYGWRVFIKVLTVGALILAATWFLPDRAFADDAAHCPQPDWPELTVEFGAAKGVRDAQLINADNGLGPVIIITMDQGSYFAAFVEVNCRFRILPVEPSWAEKLIDDYLGSMV